MLTLTSKTLYQKNNQFYYLVVLLANDGFCSQRLYYNLVNILITNALLSTVVDIMIYSFSIAATLRLFVDKSDDTNVKQIVRTYL
jgi:hypothetical protein